MKLASDFYKIKVQYKQIILKCFVLSIVLLEPVAFCQSYGK